MAVDKLREAADAHHRRRCPSAKAAQRRVPDKYKQRRDVRLVLIEQPLPKLQHLGGGSDTAGQSFLYDEDAIDRQASVISLYPGVAPGLAQLSRVLMPAIEYLWVDMVWRKNDDLYKDALNIKGHLFGRQRLPPWPGRPPVETEVRCEMLLLPHPSETGGHRGSLLPWSLTTSMGLRILLSRATIATPSKSDNLPVLEHVDRALRRPQQILKRIAPTTWSLEQNYDDMARAATNYVLPGQAEGFKRCALQESNPKFPDHWTCQTPPSQWLSPGTVDLAQTCGKTSVVSDEQPRIGRDRQEDYYGA